jgi:nitrogen regulatory protein P-II 1
MKKIEAVIRPFMLDEVKNELTKAGVVGMTALEAKGFGRQKGQSGIHRGSEYTVDFRPKVKIEMVVPDDLASKAVQAIIKVTKTGEIGDGKIFISTIDEVIRIRTGETGEGAL